MIKVGIVGGTGYTGVELLRLLAQHPNVQLQAITSRSEAGMPVAQMFPASVAGWTWRSASQALMCLVPVMSFSSRPLMVSP